jgi:type VI protein secretion system component VasK
MTRNRNAQEHVLKEVRAKYPRAFNTPLWILYTIALIIPIAAFVLLITGRGISNDRALVWFLATGLVALIFFFFCLWEACQMRRIQPYQQTTITDAWRRERDKEAEIARSPAPRSSQLGARES